MECSDHHCNDIMISTINDDLNDQEQLQLLFVTNNSDEELKLGKLRDLLIARILQLASNILVSIWNRAAPL